MHPQFVHPTSFLPLSYSFCWHCWGFLGLQPFPSIHLPCCGGHQSQKNRAKDGLSLSNFIYRQTPPTSHWPEQWGALAIWVGTPATPGQRGRGRKYRDMFYMAHFLQTGHAAPSDQRLPLAMFQAGFKPNECAAQMMPQTPRVSSEHGVLTRSPHTQTLSQALAPHGRVAANPCADLILIAWTSVSIMASKLIVVLCVIQATTSTSYHNALPEHDTESVKFHFLVPQIPM